MNLLPNLLLLVIPVTTEQWIDPLGRDLWRLARTPEQRQKLEYLRNRFGDIWRPSTGDYWWADEHTLEMADELYGSGDWDVHRTAREVEQHMASSVEGMARLFLREATLVNRLKKEGARLRRLIADRNLEIQEERIVNEKIGDVRLFLPDDQIRGALVGIYRIQDMYRIPLEEMVRGNLSSLSSHNHRQPVRHLDSRDCMLVAQAVIEKQDLSLAVEWLKVTQKLTKQEGRDDTFIKKELKAAIRHHDLTALKVGKFYRSQVTMDEITTRIEPYNTGMAKKYRAKVDKFQKDWEKVKNSFPMLEDPKKYGDEFGTRDLAVVLQDRISDQCLAEPGSQAVIQHKLHCHLLTRTHPYLRLGPQHLEQLSERPAVAIIHHFLSEDQCDSFMLLGQGHMKATPLTEPASLTTSEKKKYTDRRMSKVFYVSPDRALVARQTNTLLDLTLGLKISQDWAAAENYQLMNYGLGGYIEPHMDSSPDNRVEGREEEDELEIKMGGERLMTFMVYLTSLEAGGGGGGNTVFNQLGLSVPPARGAALLWHTIKSDGRADLRMMHLGCPVVTGDKWIVNKWIKWYPHMASHPCFRNKKHYEIKH